MYKVGDAVLTKIGFTWVPATITKLPNEHGNYGIVFKYGKKMQKWLADESQLKFA